MKTIVRWAITNSPAMNTLVAAVLIVGAVSMSLMRREIFPEFDLEIILVSVTYPGASPDEVEEGICQKLEEAIRAINGVKKQTAVAQEGAGFLVVELNTGVDVTKTLAEIRSEVDRITTFPELAEDPEIKQITLRSVAIRLGVLGPQDESAESELALREVAEKVRTELLLLPSISQVNLIGVRDYQIDVEMDEATLRKYGLSLQQVAAIIRRENIELPGGSMKTQSEEVLLRGKNKRLTGEEIAQIPLLTREGGLVLTLGEVAKVKDGFTDDTALNLVNGYPAMVLSIDRTAEEDLLRISEEVHRYVATAELPPGYRMMTWQDTAIDVRDRIQLLRVNGVQGLILVFIVLAIFLDLRLAFWVALGIPIALFGACIVLLGTGETLNMISLFAFLLTLGIVVDDGIVIGENIFAHRQAGHGLTQSAVLGTSEVITSVTSSVLTTVIAFVPLLYVSGVMGKFIAVMPVTVIAMLMFSLAETMFVLPCHLAHPHHGFFRFLSWILFPLRPFGWLLVWCNRHADPLLERFVTRIYVPLLDWVLTHRSVTMATAFAALMVTAGFIPAGITPWTLFPKLDSNWVQARITFPDGTPAAITSAAAARLEQALLQADAELSGGQGQLVKLIHRSVGEIVAPGSLGPDSRSNGSHLGMVFVELQDTSKRTVTSEEILQAWRKATGEISGADSLVYGTPEMGPGGAAIEFKLLTTQDKMGQLEEAVEKIKAELGNSSKYPGVVDIRDDSRPGKWEYQVRVTDKALALGVPTTELAETVRASYYGAEAMRLQRGRHEVKLMVRYPESDRQSLASFEDIRVRTSDGIERPLTELAAVNVERGYNEINRRDQLRSITITADVQENQTTSREVLTRLRETFLPALLETHPDVSIRWEGQQEQSNESMNSLLVGFLIASFAMFTLLTLVFRSYSQPFIIMMIIPFGFVGALWGHALMGLSITLFSLFGLVALAGVVVNDSIVLIDFINTRVADGCSVPVAIREAGIRRFRPVLLTSLTTVAGLAPILMERSFQAQVLIPMAASLSFGLMLSTVLVLLLLPVIYSVFASIAPQRAAHPQTEMIDDVPLPGVVATAAHVGSS